MRRASGCWGLVLLGVAATTGCNLNPRPEDPGAGGQRSPMGSATTGSDGAAAMPGDPTFMPPGPPTVDTIADGGVQGIDAAGVNPPPSMGGDAAIDVTVPDGEALDSPVGP